MAFTEEYLQSQEVEERKYFDLPGFKDNLIEMQKSEDIRKDLFEFDIEYQIKELMKRYLVKINLIYGTQEIENVKPKQVRAQVNQYVFS